MKLALGNDHAGYGLKEFLKEYLKSFPDISVHDFGSFSAEPVDYPDVAVKVAEAVACGEADRGLLICGTGIGMSMTANKIAGIRAARCEDPVSAYLARAHNDANVLTLGGRTIGTELAKETLKAFLHGNFDGGRHERRIEKIKLIEGNASKSTK